MTEKLTAPALDRLLRCFNKRWMNPSAPTVEVRRAMDLLFSALADLKPLEKNDEAKAIWLRAPRGTLEDFGGFEDMRDLGEVGSYEEYLALWKEEYPSEYKWYELVVAEGGDYRVVSVEECAVINARLDWGYYFAVKGKAWNRAVESVRFYLALKEAGLPVVLEDAEEIITRFEGTDYVGIVPHSVIPAYCGGMFPPEYGPVIDFMHVYSDEIGQLEGLITWLPERQAELIQGQRNGETLES